MPGNELPYAITQRFTRGSHHIDLGTARIGNQGGVSQARLQRSKRRGNRPHRGSQKDKIGRSEEHTSELQSLMRISYAVFCLKKKNKNTSKKSHSINTY